MTIGEALRRFRVEFHLRPDEVAKALDITRQMYNFYELDKSNPPSKKILELAILFDVTTDYLLGLSDVPRPHDSAALVKAIGSCQKILSDALAARP